MNREIKFRIWDDNKKEWLGASDDKTLTYYGFSLVGEIMTVQSPPQWALDERMVVEQYSGVNDIHDDEIYEGDIVKIQNATITLPYEYITDGTPIYYEHGAFRFNAGKGEHLIPDEMFMEVIGNIHENPELLEGK